MATTAALRAYANLPSEVPEALLATHLGYAEAELRRLLAVAAVPAEAVALWDEAVTVRALASLLPWLNTFALDGAAKVGRLEGAVEYRFLTPEDVAARVRDLMQRFGALVAAIRALLPAGDAGVTLPNLTMFAV